MPLVLRDDVATDERINARLYGSIEQGTRAYEVAFSLLRNCTTGQAVDDRGGIVAMFFRFCRTKGIDPLEAEPKDIEDWVASMRKLSRNTVQGRISHVRAFYVHAGKKKGGPTKKIHIQREEIIRAPALKRVECQRLLDGVRADLQDPGTILAAARDLALLLLLIVLGPRRAEATRLCFGDFQTTDEGQRYIFTRAKFRKAPVTPLAPSVCDAFDLWFALLEKAVGRPLRPDDAIFPSLSRVTGPLAQYRETAIPPMSKTGLGDIVRRRLVAAKILGPKLGPHRLRATAATLAYINGASLDDVRELLNHASITTTMIYLQSIEDSRNTAAMKNPFSEYRVDGS